MKAVGIVGFGLHIRERLCMAFEGQKQPKLEALQSQNGLVVFDRKRPGRGRLAIILTVDTTSGQVTRSHALRADGHTVTVDGRSVSRGGLEINGLRFRVHRRGSKSHA